jgi:hypothetical protein
MNNENDGAGLSSRNRVLRQPCQLLIAYLIRVEGVSAEMLRRW